MKDVFFRFFLFFLAFVFDRTVLLAVTQISSPEEVCYFFSYGLYTNTKFVVEDLGYFPEYLGVFKLEDYEFSYSRSPVDKRATGGNVQPKIGKVVYGVLWKLKEEDFSILDKEEHAPIAYTRTLLPVVSVNDPKNSQCAEVYIANPDFISKTYFPRPIYVERVIRGARENNFPEEYIHTYLEWSGPWGEN